MNDKLISMLENTKYESHKGNSWEYPENSYNAIVSALFDSNNDGVEFDVRMTKDGKFVIRHDDRLITTANSLGKISEMTLDELRKLSIGFHKIDYFIHLLQTLQDFKDEHSIHQRKQLKKLFLKKDKIITLEELLELAPIDKKLLLEVKGNDEYYRTDKFSKGILELVNSYKNKNIHIHGKDVKSMLWFKNHVDNVPVGIGIGKDLSVMDLPLDHACFDLPNVDGRIEEIVSYLEKRPNRDTHFWKVETKKELEVYKKFLSKMIERGLTNPTAIMGNDIEATKILVRNSIFKLKNVSMENNTK